MNDCSERSQVSLVTTSYFNSSSSSLYISSPKDLLKKKRRSNTRGRSVTFPESAEQLAQVVDHIANREDLTEEDRTALWFSAEDYLVLKSDARLESLASERDKLAKNLLSGVYREKSKQCQDKLDRWVAEAGQERRGLEKSSNKELAEERQTIQFQSIMDVLRTQDEMLLSRQRAINDSELRKVYTTASRASRHFARMMAKADALAAGTSPDAVLDSNAMAQKQSSRKLQLEKKNNCSDGDLSVSDSMSVMSAVRATKKKSSKEKKSKTKDKVTKDKTTEKDNKQKLSLKQKYKETKAGIMSRIPRIA